KADPGPPFAPVEGRDGQQPRAGGRRNPPCPGADLSFKIGQGHAVQIPIEHAFDDGPIFGPVKGAGRRARTDARAEPSTASVLAESASSAATSTTRPHPPLGGRPSASRAPNLSGQNR